MLSDPTKETAEAYGVLNPDWGVPNRHTFYIDADGTILAIDRTINPATSAQDIAAKLAELDVARVAKEEAAAESESEAEA